MNNYFIKNKEKAIKAAKQLDKEFYKKVIIPDLKFRYDNEWENYDSPEYFDYYEITNTMIPEFVEQKNIGNEDILLAIAGTFLINEPYGISDYFSSEGLLYALSCKVNKSTNNKEELIEWLNDLRFLIEKNNSVSNKEILIKYIEESLDSIKGE